MEECSSLVMRKMPKKLKDPVLLIQIGDNDMVHALSDLGKIINLMTLYVFSTLVLGKSRLCSLVLQIVDRTRVHLEGIIKDVFIKVCKFIIPMDFIMHKYDIYNMVLIILRCLFLAIGTKLIDVRESTLKIRLDDER